jgi:hypothetical protein
MLTTAQRATIVPPTPSSRLFLAPIRARQAVLGDGWWWWSPSWDRWPNFAGLVLAARYGPIRCLMLNNVPDRLLITRLGQ